MKINNHLKLRLICLCLGLSTLSAQDLLPNLQNYQLDIQPTDESIQIDGQLDEQVWSIADKADNFWLQAPIDGERATKNTEVRMTYNDRFIYIAATCFDDPDLIIQTLKRDIFDGSDAFAVIIDPVMEQTNGVAFAVNAMGAQTESLIFPDGSNDNWDNRWFVDVKRYTDRWTVEMAIPYKTLRFKSGIQNWGINFIRVDPGQNETYVWAPVPRQFPFFDIGYLGRLNWDKAPSKQGSNVSFIPYVTSNYSEDFQNKTSDVGLDFGGDAKVAISPTLNLDLTVNPDFSQVEVDRQVTNLTRFNIFFPERRQFFLENNDIFDSFGLFADRPFYSRRIGLDPGGRTVPIVYGARLSGNINSKLRIGAFNMHTQGDSDRNAQNYSSLILQQRVWDRSLIKGIFLNRQAFNDGEMLDEDYGRNLGGEFSYTTQDGNWVGKAGYIQSFKEGFENKNSHTYGRLDYNGQKFRGFIGIQNMQENYFADMGFTGRLFNFDPESGETVRIGFTQIASMVNYYIFPEKARKVNFHWSGIENFVYVNPDGTLNEWYLRLRHFFFFKNTSQLRFRVNYNYVNLPFAFPISDPPLPAGIYDMIEFNTQFNTDLRKRINTEMFIVYGQFYNGTKLTYRGNLRFRAQPWGNFSLGLERNDIWLPEPYGYVNLTLANARFEINFATNLFWTTFLQYNTQANDFSINSRFQWRFAPMSDVFLVYTDRYLVDGLFGPKDRFLTLKVNYWLTL